MITAPGSRRETLVAQLELLREVTLGRPARAGLDRTLEHILECICRAAGWRLGQAWAPDASGALGWRAASQGDETVRAFVSASAASTFPLDGAGLPPAAWSAGVACPLADPASEGTARCDAAARAGLGAAVALPAMADGRPVAVLEFFTDEWLDADREWAGIVSAAAQELGPMLLEAKAEDGIQAELAGLRGVERRLLQQEAQLAEAQELAGLGTFEADLSTGEIRCSQQLYRIYGVTPGDVEPSWEAFLERVHPDDAARVREEVSRALGGHRPVSTLHCIVRADGEIRELHTRMKVIGPGRSPDAPRVIGLCQDVTEQRHEAEERLEERERFRLAFEDAPIGMALVAPKGRWLQANRVLCEMTGYSEEALLARTYQDITHPDDVSAAIARGEGLMRGDRSSYPVEVRLVHADGHAVQARVTATLVRHVDGRARYFVAHFEDVTEPRQIKNALRESRERLQAIIDNTKAPLYLKDLDGRHLLLNAAAAEMMGRAPEDVVGRTDPELWPRSVAEDFMASDQAVIESGAPLELEQTVLHNGEPRTYISQKFLLRDSDGKPYAIGGISTDISERVRVEGENRRLEAELHQTQRLEMVGRLAGGIAHDFNNLMAVIINYAALLQQDVAEGSEPAEELFEIRKAADQATALTQRLVAFSRGEIVEPEVVHVGDVMHEAEKLLRVSVGDEVELRIDRSPDSWPVEADVDQLQSVLLNLALNARDAMPSGGSLSIAVTNVVLDADRAASVPEPIRPGRYVCLGVTDTGCGMEEGVAARAFEPFFTTKGPDKAGGLGLAMVYGIVRQAGGRVELDSRPGRGTTVRVFLPATDREPGRHEGALAGGRGPGGGQTVLVVEDEDSVRGLVARVLSRNGYRVLEARGPQDAFPRLAGCGDEIDLLLSDVVLPGMSGPDLAQGLCAAQPGLKAVFMSGYASDVALAIDGARAPLLKKPFTVTGLLSFVAEALAPAGGSYSA